MIMMVGLSSRIGEEAVLSSQRRRVEGLEELFYHHQLHYHLVKFPDALCEHRL